MQEKYKALLEDDLTHLVVIRMKIYSGMTSDSSDCTGAHVCVCVCKCVSFCEFAGG